MIIFHNEPSALLRCSMDGAGTRPSDRETVQNGHSLHLPKAPPLAPSKVGLCCAARPARRAANYQRQGRCLKRCWCKVMTRLDTASSGHSTQLRGHWGYPAQLETASRPAAKLMVPSAAWDRTGQLNPHDQFSISRVVHGGPLSRPAIRITILPPRYNWICDRGPPMWNDAEEALCEPYPPYRTIGAVHLAGPWQDQELQRTPRRGRQLRGDAAARGQALGVAAAAVCPMSGASTITFHGTLEGVAR